MKTLSTLIIMLLSPMASHAATPATSESCEKPAFAREFTQRFQSDFSAQMQADRERALEHDKKIKSWMRKMVEAGAWSQQQAEAFVAAAALEPEAAEREAIRKNKLGELQMMMVVYDSLENINRNAVDGGRVPCRFGVQTLGMLSDLREMTAYNWRMAEEGMLAAAKQKNVQLP